MQILAVHQPEEENSDSFAERAENYYQKRPQLLSLLHDLHKSYLYLAERYSQSVLPKHHPIPTVHRSNSISSDAESDAESSVSFQPIPATNLNPNDLDDALTALVLACVEKDVLAECVSDWDRRQWEWSRKVELQRNLVELLESERMVLMAENSRLAFQAATGEEEGKALAAEVGYTRKKAGELARCVLRMQEEHGSCMLGRRIEALQKQVIALQKRNGEWYEAMLKREREEGEVRMEVERLREENRWLRHKNLSDAVKAKAAVAGEGRRGWWGEKWWERVRRVEWGLVGHCGSGGGVLVKGNKGGCFGDNSQ